MGPWQCWLVDLRLDLHHTTYLPWGLASQLQLLPLSLLAWHLQGTGIGNMQAWRLCQLAGAGVLGEQRAVVCVVSLSSVVPCVSMLLC